MTSPTITNIVAVVREASPEGCTARYVARITGESQQAVTKALDLQVQAKVLSSETYQAGGNPAITVYKVREGA